MQKELDIMGKGFKKYGWEWEDGYVAPNFGVVYCRDKDFENELLKIKEKDELKSGVGGC